MTIFDDPKFGLSRVDGIEVDPQDIEVVEALEVAEPRRISWVVVDRWCRDHPGHIRLIPGRTAQTSTYLRQRFPHLRVRAHKHRGRAGAVSTTESKLCDLLIVYVEPGEKSPFDEPIPGIALRMNDPGVARRDSPSRA